MILVSCFGFYAIEEVVSFSRFYRFALAGKELQLSQLWVLARSSGNTCGKVGLVL